MARPKLTTKRARGLGIILKMLDSTLEPVMDKKEAKGRPYREFGWTKEQWDEMLAGREFIREVIRDRQS